jgi:tryptophan synthase alpha chain
MSRIADAFARARAENRAALVVYLCAGDPDLETTPALVRAAADAGADVIELGMPFSDPTADGPDIQRASERALGAGTTLRGVLEAVAAVRQTHATPLVLFGYYNPILAYGEPRFVAEAIAAGVDGLLVVDLPPEEAAPLRDPAVAAGLDWIPLVAPTSTDARVDAAADAATAFLYYVSLTGVTGAAPVALDVAAVRARDVARRTGKPVALGFGVKTPDDVRLVAKHADGVVVGSAVVRAIEHGVSAEEKRSAVASLVTGLAAATRRD